MSFDKCLSKDYFFLPFSLSFSICPSSLFMESSHVSVFCVCVYVLFIYLFINGSRFGDEVTLSI